MLALVQGRLAQVHQEGGSFWAELVEFPGCFAAGDTLDELQASLSEAVALATATRSVTA